MLWTKYLCPSQILSPNVKVLGGGGFGRKISYKSCLMSGIHSFIRRETRVSLHHVKDAEKTNICKPEIMLLPNTRSAHTLILCFQPPELREINICCLSTSVYGTLLQPSRLNKTPGKFNNTPIRKKSEYA